MFLDHFHPFLAPITSPNLLTMVSDTPMKRIIAALNLWKRFPTISAPEQKYGPIVTRRRARTALRSISKL